MSWIKNFFSSSIGRKIIMSLTGLFLTLFLVVHLTGNIQLLFDDGGEAFNKYADFMGSNPLIQTIAIGNFFFIIVHFIDGILLTLRNRKARPVAYASTNKSSTWFSRNMLIFGAVIFVFILVHLSNFWYVSKFGSIETIKYGSTEVKNIYALAHAKFSNIIYVALYVGSMLFVAFHLWHGFQSAFQTIGLAHEKYTPIIKSAGYGLTILVCLGFAAIPLLIYFKILF